MLHSLELLVSIPQVLVLSLVVRLAGTAVLIGRAEALPEEVNRRSLTQVLLECLLCGFGNRNRGLSIV